MAYGKHWEWRGFGEVSKHFLETYKSLPLLFQTQEVIDEYLWVPDLETNIKLRTGAEGGFKFKRLISKSSSFEQWLEDEKEIFFFPLQPDAWQTLNSEFQSVNISLPDYPQTPVTREVFFEIMKQLNLRIVVVHKRRESKISNGIHGKIKIEFVQISSPENISSIGLENIDSKNFSDKELREDLKYSVDQFGLEKEALKVMSYMKAIKNWSKNKTSS